MMTMRFAGRLVFTLALALVSPLLAANASQAATLIVSNGILQGADGVDVGGTLYDVRFIDDSCVSLFGGCDSPSDFDFQDQATASVAALALIDQVFIDAVQGNFDSQPELTNGCTSTLTCAAITPYSVTSIFPGFSAVVAFGAYNNATFNAVQQVGISSTSDISGSGGLTYSRFTRVATVAEPSAFALLGGGLALAGLAGRRRR